MRFYVAGGLKEHGRNCFLIEGTEDSILVDCGVGAGGQITYPLLSEEQVKRIRYCFVTHCHKDHLGAAGWLRKMGFTGTFVMSEETREQAGMSGENVRVLGCRLPGEECITEELQVRYGRSGHCPGSLWYLIRFQGKSLFFSGDYCETSSVYVCDPVSEKAAGLAVVDCAYGDFGASAAECTEMLSRNLYRLAEYQQTALLPAPACGRGVDLLCMCLKYKADMPVYGDEDVLLQAEKLNASQWAKAGALENIGMCRKLSEWDGGPGFLILSDPQLKSAYGRTLAERVLASDGAVIITGHAYKGTYADSLLAEKRARKLLYPVHMNATAAAGLCARNLFEIIIPNHCPKEVHTLSGAANLSVGDDVIF